jgi:hypothetical protein
MSRMTAAERTDLCKLVRLNAKVAKDDAEARGKQLLADAEARLATVFKAEDDWWADITDHVNRVVAEADQAVAALSRERGIAEEFRPSIHWGFYGRGENAIAARRAELRKVAQADVAARVKAAQVEIDRKAAQQMTGITQAGLTSAEAKAFISAMPKPEELLPPLGALHLANGKTVTLPAPVTDETDEGTGNGTAVTGKRNACAFCGRPFSPSRRDTKYCRPACRVADYRQRLKDG